MNGTGIIRRIDDLGRVVIPKNVRRAMRFRENEPLEIFSTDEGILLKQYDSAKSIAEVLRELQELVIDAEELECRFVVLGKIKEIMTVLSAEESERKG